MQSEEKILKALSTPGQADVEAVAKEVEMSRGNAQKVLQYLRENGLIGFQTITTASGRTKVIYRPRDIPVSHTSETDEHKEQQEQENIKNMRTREQENRRT